MPQQQQQQLWLTFPECMGKTWRGGTPFVVCSIIRINQGISKIFVVKDKKKYNK
jgi:hypothetical protein